MKLDYPVPQCMLCSWFSIKRNIVIIFWCGLYRIHMVISFIVDIFFLEIFIDVFVKKMKKMWTFGFDVMYPGMYWFKWNACLFCYLLLVLQCNWNSVSRNANKNCFSVRWFLNFKLKLCLFLTRKTQSSKIDKFVMCV